MAEISFTGNKLLKSIANEFTSKFPYLWLRWYNKEGNANSWESTHGSIRAKKSASELSTNSSMHVGTFEKRYEEAYGVKIEVMYIKGGTKYLSLDEDNHLTLAEYNKKVAEKGAQKAKDAIPDFK